jgi:hypothetical protein
VPLVSWCFASTEYVNCALSIGSCKQRVAGGNVRRSSDLLCQRCRSRGRAHELEELRYDSAAGQQIRFRPEPQQRTFVLACPRTPSVFDSTRAQSLEKCTRVLTALQHFHQR